MENNEKDIIRKIVLAYIALSPENLFMDGELPAAAARARAKQIHAELKGHFKALGRVISEAEALGNPEYVALLRA